MHKPYLILHINMAGCNYRVLINDVPMDGMIGNAGAITTNIPINEWVKSGENTIGLEVFPAKSAAQLVKMGQVCDTTVALQVRPSGTQEKY